MSPNRIVAVFTPVFVAVAALVSGYVAKTTGLNVTPAELVSVETTVGVAAAASAIKWLHGWSVYEKAEKGAEYAEKDAALYGVQVPSDAEIEAKVEAAVATHLVKLAAAIPPPPAAKAVDSPPAGSPANQAVAEKLPA
jgi:hypothetical protein